MLQPARPLPHPIIESPPFSNRVVRERQLNGTSLHDSPSRASWTSSHRGARRGIRHRAIIETAVNTGTLNAGSDLTTVFSLCLLRCQRPSSIDNAEQSLGSAVHFGMDLVDGQ